MAKLVIKKGRHHHSNWWFHIRHFFTKGISQYYVQHLQDCWYPYLNEDSDDWNKVHGVKGYKRVTINGKKVTANEGCIVSKPVFDKQGRIKIGFYGRENGKTWHIAVGGDFSFWDKPFTSVKVIDNHIRKGYQFVCGDYHYFWKHSNPEGLLSMQWFHGGNNKASQKMTLNLLEL